MELNLKFVKNNAFIFLMHVSISMYSFSSFAQTKKLEIDQNKSTVEFLAIGNPSALKIKGEKAKINGTLTLLLNNIEAKFKVDLNEFVTGIDMRDEHMKEKYFETEKIENRYSTFEINNIKLPESYWTKNEEFKGTFKGKLKLHNVENDVLCTITFYPYKKGEQLISASKISIKISDFKIDIPSFVGITMAEVVDVDVKLFLNVVDK